MNDGSDLTRARSAKLRRDRDQLRRRWTSQLGVSVDASWPPGLAGALCGIVLLCTPPVLVAFVIAVVDQLRRLWSRPA